MENLIQQDNASYGETISEKRNRPLPRVKPMLALRKDNPFDHPDWIFELKHEGCRAIATIHKSFVQLQSRNLTSFNASCPQVIDELKTINHTVVLDGEIVSARYPDGNISRHYYVNDILHLNGFDLFEVPLIKRKELLRESLESLNLKHVSYTEHLRQEGNSVFEEAIIKKCNGILARHAFSPYRAGRRTRDWLKINVMNRQEMIIAGFTPAREGKNFFTELILATHDGNNLKFAGLCGKGFTEKSLEKIYDRLTPHFTSKCPFANKWVSGNAIQWITPVVYAEVQFPGRTRDGKIKNAVFNRLILPEKASSAITMQ